MKSLEGTEISGVLRWFEHFWSLDWDWECVFWVCFVCVSVELGALSLSLSAFCGGLGFWEGRDIGFCLWGVLSGKDVVFEQRIGVSDSPISGGREVQGDRAQVRFFFVIIVAISLFWACFWVLNTVSFWGGIGWSKSRASSST